MSQQTQEPVAVLIPTYDGNSYQSLNGHMPSETTLLYTFPPDAATRIAELEKQRDTLLAALKEATNPNGCAWHPDKFAKLIANAEGESITGTIKCAAGCGNDVPVMAKDEGYDHICKNCGVTYTYAAEDCMSAARLNAIDTSECVKEQA